MPSRPSRLRDDRGETLVEVLVAVAILGIASVAVVGGLQLSVKASDINRKQTTGGTYVRTYAESIERYLTTTANYVKCAGAGTYTPAVVGFTVPDGYSAQQLASQPLDGDGSVITSGSCPSRDRGVQRIRLTLTSADGRASESLTVVVRRACGTGSACD